MKPEVTKERITPTKAGQYLALNNGNRNLRQRVVEQLARDMEAGRWRFTGDPIRFDTDGVLIDGQHRLAASVLAKKPFDTLVVRGVDHGVQTVVDSGVKRTMGDVLKLRGETNTYALGSLLNLCWRYENDLLRHGTASSTGPTHTELLDYLAKNPGVRDALLVGAAVERGIPLSRTYIACIYYQASKVLDVEDVEDFFNKLGTGAGLEPDSPILALRTWALKRAGERDKPRGHIYVATIIKALNWWLEGRPVLRGGSIRWRSGGAQREDFPTIHAPD